MRISYCPLNPRIIPSLQFCRILLRQNDDRYRASSSLGHHGMGSNVAGLVSCIIREDSEAVQFVSKGWTVPRNVTLSRYVEETEKKSLDHIFANTIEYEMECEVKDRLLVLDTYEDKLFVKWLSGKEDKKLVREILLQDSMSQVLAAVVFSEDEEIKAFVNESLVVGDDHVEERIKALLIKCPNIKIQIAVKWKFMRNHERLRPDLVFERMTRWLTLNEMKQTAKKCLSTDCQFVEIIMKNAQLSSFFASVLPRDELFGLVWDGGNGPQMELIGRCWGEEFYPKTLLIKFRIKSGGCKGKSLFHRYCVSDNLNLT